MDPNTLLVLFAVLACPIGMGLMMWMMNRNMGGQSGHSMPSDQTPVNSADRLATLRQQRQALEAEIAEVTRLIELEAQRKALLNSVAEQERDVHADGHHQPDSTNAERRPEERLPTNEAAEERDAHQ